MSNYKEQSVAELTWSDVELLGMNWVAEGRDLLLKFDFPKLGICTLLCTWSREIQIDLKTKENEGGFPLTWTAKFNSIPDIGWKVLLDFADKGSIGLICNEINLS